MTGRAPRRRAGSAAAAALTFSLLSGCALQAPAASTTTSDPAKNRAGATVFATTARPALPALSGVTLTGGFLNLASLRGHVLVLNVWASWCVPCKAESPALVRVARATASRGVVFVGIDENDQDQAAKAFLAGIGSTYPNLVDPQDALLAQLRMLPLAIPSSLVVDTTGHVAARVIGATTAPQMTQLLADLLAKH